MTYRLIDHTGHADGYFSNRPASYGTDYEALSAALALEKIEVLNGDNVHLSIVDDRQRRLYEIKVSCRREVKK